MKKNLIFIVYNDAFDMFKKQKRQLMYLKGCLKWRGSTLI
jgi:hypothetical protein